ncbi:MAG: hypothetical protein P8P74_14145 [Crocinitomicaceae bacterium]|nr:hypothetical protein [Crocinitomicaceae bacterium]
MKKLLFICSILITLNATAQSPEGINYQAVVRDPAGATITNAPVGLKLSLLQSSATGTVVYEESFAPFSNDFGLVNVVFGQGTVISGSFTTVDWSVGPYFIEVAADVTGGSSYSVLGTQQLMSVPYALYAKSAENAFSGDYNDLTNQPVLPTLTSELTNDSGFITSPDDADADPTNELQDITLSGSTLTITGGSSVDLSTVNPPLTEAQVDAYVANNGYLTTEVDGSNTNELQTLSISGNSITLSNGGGTVAVPDPVQLSAGGRVGMCAGSTASGAGWTSYNSTTIQINVSTAGCAFASTPQYFTSIGGLGSHFELVGASAIYSPSSNGFTVYLKKNDGSTVSPADAVSGGWYLNWQGIGN